MAEFGSDLAHSEYPAAVRLLKVLKDKNVLLTDEFSLCIEAYNIKKAKITNWRQ